MKKIYTLLALSTLFFCVHAEDIIQVAPFETTPGITENEWEISLSVNMTNTNVYKALQFDLYLPDGMTLIVDEPLEFNEDRFEGVTKKGVFIASHDYDITKPSNGHYFIKIYSDNLEDVIKGTEGEILRLFFLTDGTMQSGIYPIYVEGTVMAIDSHTDVKPVRSSSYVIVKKEGEETPNLDASILEGYIPSFVVEKMNEKLANFSYYDFSNVDEMGGTFAPQDNALQNIKKESAYATTLAGKPNVILEGVCNKLELSDGSTFKTPIVFKATSASYTRSMEGHEWGTICLPFSATSSNANVYSLKSVSADIMSFEPTGSSTISANTPYVIKKTNNETEVTFTASNVEVAATPAESKASTGAPDWTLIGTTIDLNFSTDLSSLYFINNDQFWQASSSLHVAPFRAYFNGPTKSSSAKFRITEETNGIETIENEAEAGVIYDLQGRAVKAAQAGQIYVQGAKKFVVK